MDGMSQAISQMELKKMDGTLLGVAFMNESTALGIKRSVTFPALELAAMLHAGQTRANRANLPRTPFIEHPLRNAIRLIRLGVSDVDVILAALLHDTVEDCADRFASLSGLAFGDEQSKRMFLSGHIAAKFGTEVLKLVLAVTNEIPTPSTLPLARDEKHSIYREHVVKAIMSDDRVLLVKFADFMDNAGGLYHQTEENGGMALRLAAKYAPLVPHFKEGIKAMRGKGLVEDENIQHMLDQVEATRQRLQGILENI